MEGFDFGQWLAFMLLFVVAVTIHEFAHAMSADLLGDPTPRSQGRISLNPVDHLDTVGTIMMGVSQFLGMGIGWGRPVLVKLINFRHPRRDNMIVAACGPLSNLLQAVVCACVLRMDFLHPFLPTQMTVQVFADAVLLNVSLFIFNLLPVGPLDGTKVLAGLLPERQGEAYTQFMQQYGMFVFMALILTRATNFVIGPTIGAMTGYLIWGQL